MIMVLFSSCGVSVSVFVFCFCWLCFFRSVSVSFSFTVVFSCMSAFWFLTVMSFAVVGISVVLLLGLSSFMCLVHLTGLFISACCWASVSVFVLFVLVLFIFMVNMFDSVLYCPS